MVEHVAGVQFEKRLTNWHHVLLCLDVMEQLEYVPIVMAVMVMESD